MDNSTILSEISNKLSILIALELEDKKGNKAQEKVEFLSQFNLTNKELAVLANTTEGSVGVMKNRIKKVNKK